MAGRRAGKSYAAAAWLLGGKTGQVSAYCARTLKSAKAIMLGIFAELNLKYDLKLVIRASTGTIIEPNGHIIQFYGLHDVSQADLLRGQKFRRVFIDEGGAFHDDLLKYCIESVIQPTLIDLKGSMIIGGTPGPIPKGYFYNITGNPGCSKPHEGRWPTWHWTFRDNPFIDAEALLEEVLTVNGWTVGHATFMREFLGIWCEDAEAIIYRYKTLFDSNGRPVWRQPPKTGRTVLVMDFGVVDRTAFSVWRQGYDSRPHIYCVDAYAKSNLELPEIAAIAHQLREKWAVNKIISDEGALGKGYANNLRSQYKLPVEPADKRNKRARIDGIRGRLAAETLHLCEGAAPLYDEWLSLCWNDVRDDHHPRQDDDLSDTACYVDAEFDAVDIKLPSTPVKSEEDMAFERAVAKAVGGTARL